MKFYYAETEGGGEVCCRVDQERRGWSVGGVRGAEEEAGGVDDGRAV